MFFELKDNASKLLLALIESNDDVFNAERILYNIKPKTLINIIKEIYNQGKQIEIYLEYEKHGSIESLNESDLVNSSSKYDSIADNSNENLMHKSELNASLSDYSRSFYSVITSSARSNKSLSSLYFSSFLSICSTESTENENNNHDNNIKAASPLEVGHDLYILAQKLAKFNKELRVLLKNEETEKSPAFMYYNSRTAQIEVKF
jgi:Ca2+-binding EF-hand superfamily protein